MADALVEAFCTWLATNLSLTLDETLYARSRPETAPDFCTLVRESSSRRAHPIASDQHQEAHFQLLTRGAYDKQANDEAERIWDWILDHRYGFELEGWRLNSVPDPRGPVCIGRDEKGRAEYSANLTLMVTRVEE